MTTNKPTPRELHIEKGGAVLFITTETADADEWIQTEARVFGELIPHRFGLRKYSLWIRPTYKVDEVVAYLESYLKA